MRAFVHAVLIKYRQYGTIILGYGLIMEILSVVPTRLVGCQPSWDHRMILFVVIMCFASFPKFDLIISLKNNKILFFFCLFGKSPEAYVSIYALSFN